MRTADSFFIDVEAGEESIIEQASGFVCGPGIQLGNVVGQFQALPHNRGSGAQGVAAVLLLFLDPFPIGPELVQSGPDLVLGQSFLGQVDQPFFALVEFCQSLGKSLVELAGAGLLVVDGAADGLAEPLSELGRQSQCRVVEDNEVLDQRAWEVRQIAETLLAAHADEVVVAAATARGPGEDQLALATGLSAALAVELLLEVVEVGPVPSGRGRSFLVDCLNGGEQVRVDYGLVPSLEQFTMVGDESGVVRTGENGVPFVDRDEPGVRVSPGGPGGQALVGHGLG